MTKHLIYTNWPDFEVTRGGSPRVIACLLRTDTQYLTFADMRNDSDASNTRLRFAIVGTPWGWQHTTSGDFRFWNSRGSANQFLRRNYKIPNEETRKAMQDSRKGRVTQHPNITSLMRELNQ